MGKIKMTLLSSFATDSIVDENGNLVVRQKGGPAYFIKTVLDKENIDYTIPYLNNFEVEVLVTPNGEFGKINSKIRTKEINWQRVKNPILISTVLDEFNLKNVKGQIFIDVQGYVRDGKNCGKKKYWQVDKDFFCVKATEEELSYLPDDFVDRQKGKMLLVTMGKKGSLLYFEDNKIEVKPNKIIETSNIIGAGDTLFAYFVARYLETNNPKQSLEYATQKTMEFLATKNH